ncbi:hypothetical protein GJV85_05215 [Sulfurimonas aquatica]|uniref:Ankyrin repeat domain-containing protein n=1 Tax=Sulfurimonas aquatica TaxID=2672570 RepID=A0A975GCP5_9BACT|nr:ankyrin repeat domain-containing protein [Sulfurimonas aquatica]QSZ41528.1 hypothetical protein GJV85_05215 [Sulfurimonas aquatica]
MYYGFKFKSRLSIVTTLFVALLLSGCLASLLDVPGSAYNNETEQLSKLLKEGDNVNGFNDAGVAGIHYAAKAGNLKALRILLDNGADVNLKAINKYNGWSPLHFAMTIPKYNSSRYQYKKLDVVKLLVQKGAKLDYKGPNGESLLHIASAQAYKGSDKITAYLISSGLNINEKDSKGKTPFDYALKNLSFSNITVLMKNGVNFNNYKGPDGSSLFHLAAGEVLRTNSALDFIDYLISQGYDINKVDENKKTALHYVYKIDIDEKNKKYLQLKTDAVATLIKKGANLTAQDNYGNTVGHYAACDGNIGVVSIYRALYKKYNLSNVRNKKNQTIEELYKGYANWHNKVADPNTSVKEMLLLKYPPSCI